ncbi:PaaI family thioesterase [Sandarakinorhabdus rubra]|uniref:PaaI family thioesterase n=1 Tax=Sandarakinorhabdus rubra TaxID=2672568 RepID=UPI0013DA4F85|nr:PaaI family thioesterase [Sandarakinorhabdus rubra]
MNAIADKIARPTGLELMQALVAADTTRRGMSQLMNFQGGAAGDGWMEFVAEPQAAHLNPLGIVHGGFAATLLDSAMGCAVHTTLPAGVGYGTVDLNITYVRAITPETGPVTARGEVLSRGRRLATARGSLHDANGKLLATGVTTCMILGDNA